MSKPEALDPLTAGSREEREEFQRERRLHCPVARTPSGPWFVASHAGLREGLPRVDHFVGSFGNTGALSEEETVLPGIPEPRHGRIRRIVNSVLAYHHVAEIERFVRELSEGYAEDVLGAGRQGDFVDLCELIARPLPCAVIAHVLGIPTEDVTQFARWSDELLANMGQDGGSRPLGELHPEFADYVDGQIHRRHGVADAPDDLVTRLLVTEVEGERLSPRAVRTQVINLIIAGNETTRNLIGNLFWRLAGDPELFARLREEPALRTTAIEESLRIDAPVQLLARTCTVPVEVEGIAITPGDRVMFGVGSANQDEKVYEDPLRFRLDRFRPREHSGFGAGPHLCPGAFLARMEASAALDALLARAGALHLDPGYRYDANPVPWALGPETLPVCVQAAAS